MNTQSDILTHVFDPIRLKGVFVSQWEVSNPWAVHGAQEPCALIHYLAEGHAWVSIEGQEPIKLHSGDLVIFPRGDAHTIGDSPHSTPQNLESILPDRPVEMLNFIQFGGGGESGKMICAGLHYEADSVRPLYHLLPPLLTVKSQIIKTEPLLIHSLNGLVSEIGAYNDGRSFILLRGFELVYLLGMRIALRSNDTLRKIAAALQSPGLGSALIAMHKNYQRSWTLDTLAQISAMSRSAFAQCFKRVLGETPIQYLTRLRLSEAKRLLSMTNLSQDAIAQKISYTSTMGMHLAFRNHYGITPGAFRKEQQDKMYEEHS